MVGRDYHEDLAAFTRQFHTSEGRPLEELKRSTDVLKGQESLRLRQFCTSECMDPYRDLDAYGDLLLTGNLDLVKADYKKRLEKRSKMLEYGTTSHQPDGSHKGVTEDIYKMRWGPTETPLYTLLNLFTLIVPTKRRSYLDIARFLIRDVKVPVDAPDLSGTRALSHSFSTKPSFDLEYAQMLYDAGGDVNTRNRYGATAITEILQVYQMQDPQVMNRAKQGLEWFLSHGGNIDVEDGDGMSGRKMIKRLGTFPAMRPIVQVAAAEDERRKRPGNKACGLCARTAETSTLSRCGKCRKVQYCSRSLRNCQVLDWPRHKKECKAVVA